MRRAVVVSVLVLVVLSLVAPSPGLGLVWRVYGPSMEPTIHDGSIVIVDDVRTPVTGYGRGDIVILSPPGHARDFPFETMIKRVVALPGEHVRVTGPLVEVDGRLLDEPYLPLALRAADSIPPVIAEQVPALELTVPSGQVFVMGDHRGMSVDSTSFGPVPIEQLHGKVLLVLGEAGLVIPASSPVAGQVLAGD